MKITIESKYKSGGGKLAQLITDYLKDLGCTNVTFNNPDEVISSVKYGVSQTFKDQTIIIETKQLPRTEYLPQKLIVTP